MPEMYEFILDPLLERLFLGGFESGGCIHSLANVNAGCGCLLLVFS